MLNRMCYIQFQKSEKVSVDNIHIGTLNYHALELWKEIR